MAPPEEEQQPEHLVAMAPPEENQRPEQVDKFGNDPNVLLAVDFLQMFRHRVPPSIEQAEKGFYDSLILHGLQLEHVEHGRIICSLRVPIRLTNSGTSLHGGAVASLVDIVGSAAIYATGAKFTGVSTDITVSYMSAAPVDEEIEIDARALRVGKNLAVVSVDLRKKATGQLIAQGRHTKYLGISKNVATSKL